MPCRQLLAIATLALMVNSAVGQPPVDAARGVEAEVKFALREAQRLTDANRPKAADRLQKLLTSLEADRILPADRRAQLVRVVRDQLRVVQADPVAPIDPATIPLPPAAARRAEEFAAVRSGLQEAVALVKEGKSAEAERKVAELSKRHPDNFAIEFLSASRQTAARRDEVVTTARAKERTAADSLAGIDRTAALPIPNDDIAYPKDFKEKTARRKADMAPSAEELRTLKALNTEITPQFNGSRLEDAIDYLSTITGLPILIDKAGLDELGINYDTRVTFALKRPVGAKTVLRAVLRQVGLTFAVRDGVVHATTPFRAREHLTTKVYSVADLVIPIDPRDPFAGNRLENALMLMDVIVSTVDPDSWEHRGGAGVIRYYDPTLAFVIRQSAEVHAQMRGGRSAK